MGFTTVPVEFESTDESGDLVFRIKAFDSAAAELEIKCLITPKSWPEIAEHIKRSLEAMDLRQ